MGSNKSKNTKELYQQKGVLYKFNNTTFNGNCLFGSGKNENNEIKPDTIQPETDDLIANQRLQEETYDQDVQEKISEKKRITFLDRTQKVICVEIKKKHKLCCLFVVVLLLVILLIVIACYFSFNNGSEITKTNKNETSSEKKNEISNREKPSSSERKPSTPQTWSALESYIDTSLQKTKFTAYYAGYEIQCSGNGYVQNLVFLRFKCKCVDVTSRTSEKCDDYESQEGACSHTLAELLRIMNRKNIYPWPSDAGLMDTGC